MNPFPFLDKALERLKPFLADERVSEISVNRPGELFIERLGVGGMERVVDAQFSSEWIRTLSERVAGSTNQVVNDEHPILSASLPTGERFQCVLPPAAPDGGAISIRKQVIHDIGLDVYKDRGAFEETKVGRQLTLSAAEEELAAMMQGDVDAMLFLRTAVRSRVSIAVSGGTSTGKTTFLNALLKELPDEERIVTIEDTRELKPITLNTVALLASKGDQGRAKVTPQELLEASLRMRPDRLMLGELRGAEAFSFLQAINTGHPGSLTTVHANSARSAYDRLALMVMQSGVALEKQEISDYLKEVIPVVVQLARLPDGRRVVSEIVFTKGDRL
ncbi:MULTISPECIES: P-type DNA transfer ATPase VirB11 [unclassified Shinella]|uniref:P-type DNA transfer ATPase VirB11 n=1 Tax=unclassified Shinella TaxID=2643062 RepID=UPI00225D112D|nr:P-type DNA transfer ATPase VirB11 [Shinella sp. YE25]MDC7259824.1 P-type DNA transfer ATPase VirB11 [Shinella sp. YE25]CAI0333995.1 Type IV secretion system protein [Rhizobiaceae bacterium]CAK7261640.1 Type IV secretion system protein [Shinella sp. WSC3-e]